MHAEGPSRGRRISRRAAEIAERASTEPSPFYANGVLASSPGLVRGTRTTLGWMPIRTSTATRLWPRMGAGVALEALQDATRRSHALRGISPSRLGGLAFAVCVGTERREKPRSREAAKGTGVKFVCRPDCGWIRRGRERTADAVGYRLSVLPT